MAGLRADHPGLVVELDITDRLVDVAGGGEADIALRGSLLPGSDPSLIQKRLPDMRWGFYCSTGYAAANGAPGGPEALDSHPIATLGGAVVESVRREAPHARIVDVTNSIGALCAAVRAGYCVGLLPCITGDADPMLRRCYAMPGGAPCGSSMPIGGARRARSSTSFSITSKGHARSSREGRAPRDRAAPGSPRPSPGAPGWRRVR